MRLILVKQVGATKDSHGPKAAIPFQFPFERMFTVGERAAGIGIVYLIQPWQEVVPLHDQRRSNPIRYSESSSVVFQCDADSH